MGEFPGNATFAPPCFKEKSSHYKCAKHLGHLAKLTVIKCKYTRTSETSCFMLSEKISICEAKMKLIFGAWLSDLNGLRLQLCITFLTHLIKIRDSLLSVTSSLPGLMIQVLRSFYSSTHASAQQLTEVYLWQHMSVVTPVSENCYDVSLNFCATQLSQGDLSRLRVMQ